MRTFDEQVAEAQRLLRELDHSMAVYDSTHGNGSTTVVSDSTFSHSFSLSLSVTNQTDEHTGDGSNANGGGGSSTPLTPPPLPTASGTPPAPKSQPEPQPRDQLPTQEEKGGGEYLVHYAAPGGQCEQSVTMRELASKLAHGDIDWQTLVWSPGMSQWTALEECLGHESWADQLEDYLQLLHDESEPEQDPTHPDRSGSNGEGRSAALVMAGEDLDDLM